MSISITYFLTPIIIISHVMIIKIKVSNLSKNHCTFSITNINSEHKKGITLSGFSYIYVTNVKTPSGINYYHFGYFIIAGL